MLNKYSIEIDGDTFIVRDESRVISRGEIGGEAKKDPILAIALTLEGKFIPSFRSIGEKEVTGEIYILKPSQGILPYSKCFLQNVTIDGWPLWKSVCINYQKKLHSLLPKVGDSIVFAGKQYDCRDESSVGEFKDCKNFQIVTRGNK